MHPTGINFFDAHTFDWLVLIGLAIFPRITMLFVGGPFNLLQWLGWLIAPHFVVAIMATSMYWQTNPVLCVIAWAFAFAGTGGEGGAARSARNRGRRWRDRRASRD